MEKEILSLAFCSHNKVITINQNENNVVIGMVNNDDDLKNRIYRTLKNENENIKIEFIKITNEKFEELYSKLIIKNLEDDNSFDKKNINNKKNADESVITLFNSIFINAIKNDATDIHIEKKLIKIRVKNKLENFVELPRDLIKSLIIRIKVLSNLDISENVYAQDGRFSYSLDETVIDVRVSILPAYDYESVVLRLLNRKNKICDFVKLGFTNKQVNVLNDFLNLKQKLILICGPTGSGKSTTLASIMNHLVEKGKKILSLEDPIEYKVEGVVQIPVRPEINLDFNNLIRRVYRQDPDVLIVGEVRDELTAQVAVSFASTGHLVFATLHTSSLFTAVLRLIDLKADKFLLKTVLYGVIFQKLDFVNEKNIMSGKILVCNEDILEMFFENKKISLLENYALENRMVS